MSTTSFVGFLVSEIRAYFQDKKKPRKQRICLFIVAAGLICNVCMSEAIVIMLETVSKVGALSVLMSPYLFRRIPKLFRRSIPHSIWLELSNKD